MRPTFSLFQSHLDLAHTYWKSHLLTSQGPHIIVDATCGNGHDALVLAKLSQNLGHLYCIDIQPQAIEKSLSLLSSHLEATTFKNITLIQSSHASFPENIPLCDLIVYNLGYLPGSDKKVKTKESSTLKSLAASLILLKAGGLVSITCYPGHSEGAIEQKSLLEYTETLSPQEFLVCHHVIPNRLKAPSLLLIFKKN